MAEATQEMASMTSEVTQAALEPCPFCRKPLRVVPSLARAFDPPRPLVEYHHADGDCIIKRAMWAFYDDEPEKFDKFAAAWNTRLTAQSGEGRSGAGEDGPTTAIIAGLWLDILEKDDRTSPEEYPDMALITEEEFAGSIRYALAALNARQSGEGERE